MFDFNVTLDVITDLREITLHTIGILVVDDLKEFLQLSTDLRHLIMGIGVDAVDELVKPEIDEEI